MASFFKSLGIFTISLILLFAGTVLYFFATLPDIARLKNENPQTTAFMEYHQQYAAKNGRKFKIRQKWVSLKQIPDLMKKTILVSEDAAFWVHKGVDWFELKRAFEKNIEKGEFVRGASTITQQLAKNLYLSPEKTILRKIQEYLIAYKLEQQLTKSRILELYLNTIEFGRGIYGLGSACEYYFGKTPQELTVDEMVRLAAIIPKPTKLNPTTQSRELIWRAKIILRRLYRFNYITEAQYQINEWFLDSGYF